MACFGSRRQLCLALLLCAPACGDDDGGNDGGSETTAALPSTTSGGMSAMSSSSTASADVSSGGADSSSGGGSSSDGESTGAPTDPTYPPIDGGVCGGNTAPVMLPDASLCAPFCAGRADACPQAASGDAPAQCTPFLDDRGSGDPCDKQTPCVDPEVCGSDGACGEVAFWACQLSCGGSETCPDGMHCSGNNICGY